MFSPKKESCRHGTTGDSGLLFELAQRGVSDAAGELARTERLKLRDKALPNRLVITSLLCDSFVIVYALVFSFWFRFQTSIHELGVPSTRTLRDYAGYLAFGGITLLFTLTAFGIYERQALLRFRFVSLQIFKAASLWALVSSGARRWR